MENDVSQGERDRFLNRADRGCEINGGTVGTLQE